MEYQVHFGTLTNQQAPARDAKKFRIALLGDFSARGNRNEVSVGAELAQRKVHFVQHDNLDEILRRLDVTLQLPAGPSGSMIEVPIRSLDDFHPDQLYTNVPIFEKLLGLRAKLLDPASFDKAASAVRALALPPGTVLPKKTKSTSCHVPRTRFEDFSQLLTAGPTKQEPGDLKTLLRDIVGTHVVSSMTGKDELVAAVDQALSGLMRTLLHHPDFQALESLWRSLDLLVHRVELDEGIEIALHDLHAAEFAADLSSSAELAETGLYQWLVEQPAMQVHHGAYAVVVANYQWEKIPPHIDLLARASKISAAAGASFLTSLDRASIKGKGDEEHPLVKQAWDDLKGLPESAYLGVISPRFLLRWPYGKKTDPIESFVFEEFSSQAGLQSMLWGHSTYLAAIALSQTFTTDGLAEMKPENCLTIDDLPFYYFQDRYGDQIALPCTEVLVNVALSQQLVNQGIIPALSMQGRPEVRLGGLHSVQGTPLAGPWNPVDIAGITPVASVRVVETPAASEPVISAAELASEPAASSGTDELDDLLAALDAGDTAKADTAAATGIDPELDALLADL
ncbi:type VI secretion system contractile sheath domain-containing protein [Pirellulaceae bacterium SH467]